MAAGTILDRDEALGKGSFYEASVTRPAPSAALVGRARADVCVVGGGYAGLSAALELAERGFSVALLEARTVGWGASGRNGGQASVGFADDAAVESQFSPADARRAWHMSNEALQLLRERIVSHTIGCDYVSGCLKLATNWRKARALEAWSKHLTKAYDYQTEWIEAGDLEEWIASKRFHSGLHDPNSGHLHPLKYCLGLAAAARRIGVHIYENSPAAKVRHGPKTAVKTAAGQVDCSFVVLAGNVHLNRFGHAVAPGLDARIMPVGTCIIATEPMAAGRADALIRGRAAVCDSNFVSDHFRTTADHRMLFGGRVGHGSAIPRDLAGSMRRRMLRVFPQLADLAVPHAWGGFIDITMNRAPDFGRLGDNVYYLQGFSGHGLALAGMAGKLVAEAVCGQAERFDLLARLKHRPFPGGEKMRTPALVLSMLYHRLRDLL